MFSASIRSMVPRLALASVGGFAISRESKAYCRAQDESPSHLLKESLAQKNFYRFKQVWQAASCGGFGGRSSFRTRE
jgi:hypothetical protein